MKCPNPYRRSADTPGRLLTLLVLFLREHVFKLFEHGLQLWGAVGDFGFGG